jgi:hypothetical protein
MFKSLEGATPSTHALIQHIGDKGYRLNPDVEIISMEEFEEL